MSGLYVCSLAALPELSARVAPGRVVSLVPAPEQPRTPPGVVPARHLRIEVDDVDESLPGASAPEARHVARLLAFLREWRAEAPAAEERAPLVLHCFAGISRSTAGALIALALDADGREIEAAALLRRAAPHAQPNRRLVAIADALLEREGRLVDAREAMGEGELCLDAPPVRLPPGL